MAMAPAERLVFSRVFSMRVFSSDRRTFLTTAGAAAMALGARGDTEEFSHGDLSSDGYEPPEWLRYSPTVYFDGYTPPVYPSLKDFDPRRLVQCAWI
jgi:hypothetical protein